jgi:hypothetical protein
MKNKSFVMVDNNGTIEKVEVVTWLVDWNKTEIISWLSENDTVVIKEVVRPTWTTAGAASIIPTPGGWMWRRMMDD